MTPRPDFPPVRACLFDMDGLLIDTEDRYTAAINTVLARYGRPLLPWSFKARLQGRAGPEAGQLLYEWSGVPIPLEQFRAEYAAEQQRIFTGAQPLPGAEQLIAALPRAGVHIALATSSATFNFDLKTAHLGGGGHGPGLFTAFPPERRVLGDDPRIPPGRGKPHPDIYLVALAAVNAALPEGERDRPITPDECIVFEDAVPGVEAGRRAGMRVVWVPHSGLRDVYRGREAEVLAGRTGEAGDVEMDRVGELGDGWGELLDSLVDFPYEKYGIRVLSE